MGGTAVLMACVSTLLLLFNKRDWVGCLFEAQYKRARLRLFLDVCCDLIVGWSEEAGQVLLAFDAAVQDVFLSNVEAISGKLLFAVIVQVDSQPLIKIAMQSCDNVRRIVNLNCGCVSTQNDFIAAIFSFAQMLAE